jgi:uncharacterized iron-regulated membrane protein
MRWGRVIAGGVMVVVGTVWIVQGAGALHGSFMTGSPTWLWIGIATAVAGLVLCVSGLRVARGRGRGSMR